MSEMTTCPRCNRPLPRPNAWHYCAEVSLDSLFEGKSPEVAYAFDALLSAVADWEGIGVSATKNCVVFVRNITFLVAKPMKTQLDIKFFLPEASHDAPIHKCKPWNSKFETHVRVKKTEEVTGAVIDLIRRSYGMS